jgi:hypothetical protein
MDLLLLPHIWYGALVIFGFAEADPSRHFGTPILDISEHSIVLL